MHKRKSERSALAKVYRSLKPGGWWAMWWTHFGSTEPDAFQLATDHLFIGTLESPSAAGKRPHPFALDQESRLQDLVTSGFCDAEVEVWRWTLTFHTARLVALYLSLLRLSSRWWGYVEGQHPNLPGIAFTHINC